MRPIGTPDTKVDIETGRLMQLYRERDEARQLAAELASKLITAHTALLFVAGVKALNAAKTQELRELVSDIQSLLADPRVQALLEKETK